MYAIVAFPGKMDAKFLDTNLPDIITISYFFVLSLGVKDNLH